MPAKPDLIDQLTADPDFLSLPEAEQDAMYEELSGQQSVAPRPLNRIAQNLSPVPLPDSPQTSNTFLQRMLTQLAVNPAMGAIGPAFEGMVGWPGQPVGRAMTQAAKQGSDALMQVPQALPEGLPREVARYATAVPATSLQLGTEAMTPPNIATAAIAGSVLGGMAESVAPAVRAVKGIPDWLRGNPKQVNSLSKTMNAKSHQIVQSLRPGGSLHNKVFETIKRESERAWAPMKQVANSIPDPVGLPEIQSALATRIQDPARLEAAKLALTDLVDARTSFSAPELVDLSSQAGSLMRKASVRGTVARSFNDMVHADIRSALADILEARAPEPLKGSVSLAKQQWANYAADRDQLFRYFQPSGSQNLPTKAGVSLLRRAALGQVNDAEAGFLQRVEQASGVDLPAKIRPIAEKLAKAQQAGKTGAWVGQQATRLAPWLIGAGAIEEGLRRHH